MRCQSSFTVLSSLLLGVRVHCNIEIFSDLLHTFIRSLVQHGSYVLLRVLVPKWLWSNNSVADIWWGRNKFRISLLCWILRGVIDVVHMVESTVVAALLSTFGWDWIHTTRAHELEIMHMMWSLNITILNSSKTWILRMLIYLMVERFKLLRTERVSLILDRMLVNFLVLVLLVTSMHSRVTIHVWLKVRGLCCFAAFGLASWLILALMEVTMALNSRSIRCKWIFLTWEWSFTSILLGVEEP